MAADSRVKWAGRVLLFAGLLLFVLAVFLVRLTEVRAHEWLAVGFTALVAWHIIGNVPGLKHLWPVSSAFFRWRAFLTCFLLLCFAATVLTGAASSQYVFSFIRVPGRGMLRDLHGSCSAWLLVCIGLHIGLYAGSMLAWLKDILGRGVLRLVQVCLLLAAVCGAVSIWQGDLLSRLTFTQTFAFFDYDRPAVLMVCDLLSELVFFAVLGFLMARVLLFC